MHLTTDGQIDTIIPYPGLSLFKIKISFYSICLYDSKASLKLFNFKVFYYVPKAP